MTLVDRALAEAGLTDIAHARRSGDLASVRAEIPRLEAADLLALGALADRVRSDEVGDVVRVYANAVPDDAADVVHFQRAEGLALLRQVAIARITGPRAARVRVDWTAIGLELAQVALGFGASELVGTIASKRGLPLAPDAMTGVAKRSEMQPAQVVKKREIAGFIERSGRRPVFVGDGDALEPRGVSTAGDQP
jgi:2-iminoacetate synthase ThiH